MIAELARLRRQAGRAKKLKQRLKDLQAECSGLQMRGDEQTRALRQECIVRDKTEEALRLAEMIIARSPVVLFRRLAGEQPNLVYVSSNISQFGYSDRDFVNGRVRFSQIVHPEDRKRLMKEVRQFADADVEEYTQSYRILTRSGEVRWVEDQTSVVRDDQGRKVYNQGIMVDVTPRRLAEEERRKSEEKFRRIVETAGEGFVLRDNHHRIVEVNDSYCRMLGYRREEILGKTAFDLATDEFRQFIAGSRERLFAMDSRKVEGALVAKDGRRVPVLIHANILRDADGAEIGHAAFVADLTEQKKALELAGKVQRNLIPAKAPQIKGLDIAGRSDPCQEVGGDYFDFLYGPEYPTGNLRVVVGDISGHGVEAALLMTTARAFIRMRAAQPAEPAQVVTLTNHDLAVDMGDSGSFMTLFYMEIDPHGRTARWVRAGHEPALLYCPVRDRFEELVGNGTPLGVTQDSGFTEQTLPALYPGSVLALGTDGIWEARDPDGRFFGKGRFRDIIRRQAAGSAQDMVTAVFDEIARFCRGLPQDDDITLVVIKIEK
ncbi:MAG TPA: SpoIIE family protein phosphatase [Syntrophobacteria bacterium]|nr:SpoIIE family protein phosphatase [Syntrophobacteria bacterium]